MAAGKITLGKQSGGTLGLVFPDGVTNTEVVLPDSGTLAKTSDIQGFKNYIINGGFDIWQRGTSGSGQGYKADRFRDLYGSGTWSRSTDVPSGIGATYSLLYNGNNSILYFTEASVSKALKGKTATLSYWIKTGSVSLPELYKQTGYENGLLEWNGTISGLITTVNSGSNSIVNQWQKVSVTYTFPNSSDMDNGLTIILGGSANTDCYIAQVQLEEGSVATPFEQRPYGLELSLCQRYYNLIDLSGIRGSGPDNSLPSTNGEGINYTYPMMRVNPTVSSFFIVKNGHITCNSASSIVTTKTTIAIIWYAGNTYWREQHYIVGVGSWAVLSAEL